jgi:hypothetical protein
MTKTSSPPPEPDRLGAVRDTRQLSALDRRTDRNLYLPEGAADDFRADCDAGHLICALPRCGDPRYLAVGGPIRRHHFRHRTAGLPPHDTRASYHLTAKLLLGQHLRDRRPEGPSGSYAGRGAGHVLVEVRSDLRPQLPAARGLRGR